MSLFPQGSEQAERLAKLFGELAATGTSDGPSEEVADYLRELRDKGRFDGWDNYLPLLKSETVGLADLLDNPLVIALDQQALLEETRHFGDTLDADYQDRLERRRLAVPTHEMAIPMGEVHDLIDGAHIPSG